MPEEPETEPGNDMQLGPDRLDLIQERLDLELAAVLEEERKTQLKPADGPG